MLKQGILYIVTETGHVDAEAEHITAGVKHKALLI